MKKNPIFESKKIGKYCKQKGKNISKFKGRLKCITTSFLEILFRNNLESVESIVDLNFMSKQLKIPKRRLYDVTSVFQGY